MDKHLNFFWQQVFGESLNESGCGGIIDAHGDKCYQYADKWEDASIPFPHGVAMYMLTYTKLMDRPKHESGEWVIKNYPTYEGLLPDLDETDDDVI